MLNVYFAVSAELTMARGMCWPQARHVIYRYRTFTIKKQAKYK
jgi:hypothetical protein